MDNNFTVTFGARSVTFYPLNLKAIRELTPEIERLSGMAQGAALAGHEVLGAAIKVLTASARRGDPAITEEDVETVIDLSNINQVIASLMGSSGFSRRDAGSSDPTSPRTGGDSTQASSPERAGAGQTSTS